MQIALPGTQNLCGTPSFLGGHILLCNKRKNRSANFHQKVKQWKYFYEHQRTCNVLIIFPNLMTSKLIHLLMDSEAVNWLSTVEEVKGVLRVLQTSTMKLFAKIGSNVNLKPLTIFAKRSILDAWLLPKSASTGG